MALTEEQKQSLSDLKTKIEEWKEEQLELIDKEFIFLNSIQLSNSVLAETTISTIVDEIVTAINDLQLTGEAYSEES